MAEERNFTLKVITPDRVFYEDDAVTMVEFNTTEGEIGIYKRHVPTTVILKPGILTITKDDEVKAAALHAGFAEILEDKVTILAEIVEWPEEIDEARAEAAKRGQRSACTARLLRQILQGQKLHCSVQWHVSQY